MSCLVALQSKVPQAVQPHLGKCFDGIRRLDFGGEDPKAPDILAMVSAEGEKVPLGKNLKVMLATCLKQKAAFARPSTLSSTLSVDLATSQVTWQCRS